MISNRALLDSKISERDWQQEVVNLLQSKGWTVFWNSDSRRATPGLPDVIAIRHPRVLFAELKTSLGKLTKTKIVKGKHGYYERLGQEETVKLLKQCPGVECEVLRPEDWLLLEEIAE